MSDGLSFSFEGKPVRARHGETVRVALCAQGLADSGGGFCAVGICHECLVVIDGEPGQRSCMILAAEGMAVRAQQGLVDASQGAPLCALPSAPIAEERVDVVVVGAGPIGRAAATGLARRGASGLLLDERVTMPDAARRTGLRFQPGTLVWGGFREQGELVLGTLYEGQVRYLRPRLLVIATGSFEQPRPRPGWTLPGVQTTQACLRLLPAHGRLSDGPVVVAGNGPSNLLLAYELARAGVRVAALVEAAAPPTGRPAQTASLLRHDPALALRLLHMWALLRAKAVPVLHGSQLLAIEGTDRVEQVIIAMPDGARRRMPAAHVCLGDGCAPANELSRLLGCRHAPDPASPGRLLALRGDEAGSSEPDIMIAGDAGGIGGAGFAAVRGRLVAAEGARRLGLAGCGGAPATDMARLLRRRRGQLALQALYAPRVPPIEAADSTIACRCEGITFGALRDRAAADHVRDVAALKRLTRAGMGRCQGRYCLPTLAGIVGGVSQELDLPAPQMPLRPVPLAAMAVEHAEWHGHARVAMTPRKAAMSLRPGGALSADAVIIGAGIVGLCTALFLARAGRKVVVLERGTPHAGASGGNAGSLHAQLLSFDHGDARGKAAPAALTLPLQRDSIALWQTLQGECEQDFELKITGGLMVAETEAEIAFLAEKTRLEQALGVDSRLMGGESLRRLEPSLAHGLIGAAYCPQEGKINPLAAGAAIARAARAAGVAIVASAEVGAIASKGGAYRIDSSAGSWQAPHVVNAAGACAAEVAQFLGLTIPVHGAPLQMVVTEPCAPLIHSLVAHAGRHLTLKQAGSGAILIGGGWGAGLDPVHGTPRPLRASLEGNLWVAQRVVPALSRLHVVRSWAAMNIDIDGAPILGEHPDRPGFYNAVTSNGYTLGPIVGRITADLILRGSADRDISMFSVARFRQAA